MSWEQVSEARCFDGSQRTYKHRSDVTGTDMRVSVFVPPQADKGPRPVLWYLSGLTCTEENVTVKAGIQRRAAKRGVIVVAPDTSPRGAGIDGEDEDWDFGTGAGFYVDATREPWAKNYRMYSYVTEELQALVTKELPVKDDAQGVTGHSMGGHGALVLALRHPERYRSVSAFAPIVHPSAVPWGKKAFTGYLGDDEKAWRAYDAVALLEDGAHCEPILVDQGDADGFLEEQLQPHRLERVCAAKGQPLTLNLREGYDHSYFFVSTFIASHLDHHADALGA